MARLILAWLSGAAAVGRLSPPATTANGAIDIESWEEPLKTESSANEKTPAKATGKKPYKTPTLRFEPVFEVSALACGKISSTQGGCSASMKAS